MAPRGQRLSSSRARPKLIDDMTADLLATGCCIKESILMLGGRRARVQATVNQAEICRRARVGLGPITVTTLLSVLADLPAHEAILWSSLDRRAQRILRQAPPGVIERDGGYVIRLLAPPVRVHQVTVRARDGRIGLEAASRFAPYARRAVELPVAAVTELVMLDAALYGIGIHVRDRGEVRELVPAEPFVVRKWTWASWLFSEQVLSEMVLTAAV